jgi:hypothetical protein
MADPIRNTLRTAARSASHPKATSASISTSRRLVPVSVIASAMNRVEIDPPQPATIQAGSNHRSAAPSCPRCVQGPSRLPTACARAGRADRAARWRTWPVYRASLRLAALLPAEQLGERAASDHSITSSARASSDGGTSRPSALAVLRLSTSSYLVGRCTGRLAGFSPLRIRSMYPAARRYWAVRSGP